MLDNIIKFNISYEKSKYGSRQIYAIYKRASKIIKKYSIKLCQLFQKEINH